MPEVKIVMNTEMIEREQQDNQTRLRQHAKELRQRVLDLREAIDQRMKEFQKNEKHSQRMKKSQLTALQNKSVMFLDKNDFDQ